MFISSFSNLQIAKHHDPSTMDALKLPSSAFGQPRPSAESDRRHLLAGSNAPSVTTSRAPSYIETDGDRTPRAGSPAPSSVVERPRIPAHTRHQSIAEPTTEPTPRPYRGFPSEEHYLAALREWAESKKYLQSTETQLVGFYGPKTLQEYADQPKMEGLGLRKKWKARKEQKLENKRRASSAV